MSARCLLLCVFGTKLHPCVLLEWHALVLTVTQLDQGYLETLFGKSQLLQRANARDIPVLIFETLCCEMHAFGFLFLSIWMCAATRWRWRLFQNCVLFSSESIPVLTSRLNEWSRRMLRRLVGRSWTPSCTSCPMLSVSSNLMIS